MAPTLPSELARCRGAATSKAAANAAVETGLVPTHEQMVRTAVTCSPPGGATAMELIARIATIYGTRLTNVQVCRRLAALLRRDEIHRRWDPARPGKHLARDGRLLHFPGPPPVEKPRQRRLPFYKVGGEDHSPWAGEAT